MSFPHILAFGFGRDFARMSTSEFIFPGQTLAPRQGRSRATVDAILEAAAQVLEAKGSPGFTTDAVATRAGVSIGTLYRYFADKQAILTALAWREKARVDGAVLKALSEPDGTLAPDRAAIRAFLQAFDGRTGVRRAALQTLMETADASELTNAFAPMEAQMRDAQGKSLPPLRAFVLSRALHGAMRAAVMERPELLADPEFENELVRLARRVASETGPANP